MEDHAEHLIFVKVDPALDALRSDPRFRAVVEHLRF
jgi:hypothetical protein